MTASEESPNSDKTRTIPARELAAPMVLVGESGGRSAIYETRQDSLIPGFVTVWTEHGALLLDPDHDYDVATDD